MKRILLLFATISLVGITACSRNDTEDTALDIVSSEVDFTAAGGNGKIILNSIGVTVSATSSADWLTVDNVSSDKVEYTVGENSTLSTRSAQIAIKGGSLTRHVTIIQGDGRFSLERKELVIDPAATEPIPLAYRTTMETLPTLTDVPEWLQATVTAEAIVFTPQVNLDGDRSADIAINCGWVTTMLKVTQGKAPLFEKSYIAFEYNDKAPKALQLAGYASSITDLKFELPGNETWLSVANNNGALEVTPLEDNEYVSMPYVRRRAIVNVSDGSGTKLLGTVDVNQNVNYDDPHTYLGTWTMAWNTAHFDGSTHDYSGTSKVVFAESDTNGLYLMRIYTTETKYDIYLATFNSVIENNRMFVGWHFIANNGTYSYYVLPLGTGFSLYQGDNESIGCTLEPEEWNGQDLAIKLIPQDSGNWPDHTVVGFGLFGYFTETGGMAGYVSYYKEVPYYTQNL